MAGRKFVTFFIVLSVVHSVKGYSVKSTDEVSLSSYSNETVQEQYLENKNTPSLFYMNQFCKKTLLLNTRNAIRVSPWTTKYPPPSVYCKMGVKNQNYPTYDLGVTFKKVSMSPRVLQICTRARLDLFNGISTTSRISGKCAHDEFKCANSKCIKNNMLCDHYDNCGDNSDEKHCRGLLLSIAAIIGIVIGGVILVAILVTIICCCCCCAQFGYESF